MKQKRCLTIQDYSCMGRCSLTVALPILSACGVEAIGLPTAVLSNHTAFSSWTYTDLTSEMRSSVDKWDNYNHHFDCIYTGYLGTQQVPVVMEIIHKLKEEHTMIMGDPAFGDNGKMYPGVDQQHVQALKQLIRLADMTCPNLTEACFLTEEAYPQNTIDIDFLKTIAKKLAQLGPHTVLLTGITFEPGTTGCLIYEREKDAFDHYQTISYPGRYHGAGDSYCSAFVGSQLQGLSVKDSVIVAHDFVHSAMKKNIEDGVDGLQYGLEFELVLSQLIQDIKQKKQTK